MKEFIKNAKKLLKQKKFQEAYRICVQIINVDPENTEALKLIQKIEKEVDKQNETITEKELETLKPLWKEREYEKLLISLQKLYKFTPHYGKLKELIIKASELLEKQKVQEDESFIKNSIERIKQLEKEEKFKEAIKQEEQLNQYIPNHPKLKEAFLHSRRSYVKFLLNEKKEFINSDKYKETIEFLEDLRKIDPFYEKIPSLIQEKQNKYYSKQSNQKKEYFFQGLENIKTLYQKKKYDKTIKAVKEILKTNKTDKLALNFLKKAINQQEKIITLQIAEQIKTQYENKYPTYLQNRNLFISL